MLRAREEAPVQHPEAGQDWFRRLSPDKQEELHDACRRDVARDRELVLEVRRKLRVSCFQVAVLYVAIDVLCPGRAWGNAGLAALVGGLVGALLERLHAGRMLSGGIGVAVFFLFQLLTRGGLTIEHMFWFFPVAAIAAFQGLRRENGG